MKVNPNKIGLIRPNEKIEIIMNDEVHYTVRCNGREARKLFYGEVLALVSSLIIPFDRPCLSWLRTEGQRGWFSENSMHEQLRRRISSFCSTYHATEKDPIDCSPANISILIKGEFGVSTLELPRLINIYHDSEAIVWATVEGHSEPFEVDDFDDSVLGEISCYLNNTLLF